MTKYLIYILLLLPNVCKAQQNLKKIRAKSWQTYAYKVTAADVEKFSKWDSIPVNEFVNKKPDYTFELDHFYNDLLGLGNYVVLSVIDNNIHAHLYNNTQLQMLTINNKDKLQIDVRNKNGNYITDAKVFINNIPAKFNQTSQTYWASQRKLDKAQVKIYATNDTMYAALNTKDDLRYPVKQQRKLNFKYSKIYKIIHFVPAKLKGIFKKKTNTNSIGASGYIIFNQPKYKPLDTLKFKAYIVDKKWKQYNSKVDVYISYYQKGKSVLQHIKTLQPTSAGAYVSEFLLADTLPLDTRYTLLLKTTSGKRIITNDFKIEEYVLDEIGSYSFKTDKQNYYRTDSLRFTAAAKDANGLHLLDGKATLLLTTQTIQSFYNDTVFVIDTIYQKEVKLNTTTDTKFVIAANTLPQAHLDINATLIFKNANNELHEEQKNITYNYLANEIKITQSADSIKAIYIQNGFEKSAAGELDVEGDTTMPIQFPYTAKIDPTIEEYSFSLADDYLITKDAEVENYKIEMANISNKDTLGFMLYNPYKIPVYYSIFEGTKTITTTKSNDSEVKWQKQMKNNKQMYKLRWQYIWAGREFSNEESIGLYFKKLQINVNAKSIVFPGQKDSIQLEINDYKGNPVSNINLTAVSYNNQFKNDIKVKDPPYLVKYKSKGFIERESFETNAVPTLDKMYLLGKNSEWIHAFNLDTMPYYKLLFPTNGLYNASTNIQNFVPEVAIHLVDKGIPEEIYLLYLNKQLVYYNGVTDKMKYSFSVYPGLVHIGIRTKNKYIELDSFYIQPNYKHDISFDINNLPPKAVVKKATNYFTSTEMQLIENSMWQMPNDYKNNNAWLWQGSSVVQLQGDRNHIAGPFLQDYIQFFSPNKFDMSFMFEAGYAYRITKNVLRLEKNPLFTKKDTSNLLPNYTPTFLKLGDTLTAPPIISYSLPSNPKFLLATNYYEHLSYARRQNGLGNILYTQQKDTAVPYTILVRADSNKASIVGNYFNGKINNVQPGTYHLLLVTNHFNTAMVKNIMVQRNGTICVKMDHLAYLPNNEFVQQLLMEAAASQLLKVKQIEEKTVPIIEKIMPLKILENGSATVQGIIVDSQTNMPIPFCSVRIQGYNVAVACDAKGYFYFKGLTDRTYTIIFAAIGYQTKFEKITLIDGEHKNLSIGLAFSNASLQEVIVSGYGETRKKQSVGFSSAKISSIFVSNATSFNMQSGLSAKVSGLYVSSHNSGIFGDTRITLRGIRSLTGNNEPILVVDGIIQRQLKLTDINPADIADISILGSAAAVAIYGADGVNGVLIVTTKNKTERKTFKDYALWQPNFFTDKNGKATIEITYPDNVTGWNTFIVAMDKKRRIGKTSFITQAYKPIVAQLNMPQFLIAGDTSYFIGKAMNYTADTYTVKTDFLINGLLKNTTQNNLIGNDANVLQLMVTPNVPDTFVAKYALQTTTGFKDAEERKMPVFRKGVEEVKGNFWVLHNDTTVQFTGLQQQADVQLYAQNNTIDVLLQEIEGLKKYPFACMEQTVSKFTGIVMEQKINMYLNVPFTNKRVMDMLLAKVQKAQLFDGGWPWWEGGTANFYITNYIVNTLLQHRDNPLVETNIRNGFLYLQNQLPFLKTSQLIAGLYTLSQGNHLLDYNTWLGKVNFDSLTIHEQWQWVSIMQQQKINTSTAFQKLINKQQVTMLGATHWGEDNYSWYKNDVATTIIAFQVLKNEPTYQYLLPNMIQYFLEKRKMGQWANTVESASILNTILPHILSIQKNTKTPATLSITGDTSFTIQQFPFAMTIKNKQINHLNIKKEGNGMVYFTLYQKYFYTTPVAETTHFITNTYFENAGQKVTLIKTGERIKMMIKIDVLKDAEYVMLQVPIPAGCNLVDKNGYSNGIYKEFFKDKVSFFAESLAKGSHVFEIALEPRYAGNYVLNPTKIVLMYYPTFYGQNEMQRVTLVDE